MSDIKKDHSIGEGTGAGAGAIAGAALGSMAGPVGTAVGAVVGAVAGAKTGGVIAEAVNPTAYTDHFKETYQAAPYYSAGKTWNDYEPAYKYSYDAYGRNKGQSFEAIEPQLERDWESSRAKSSLAWTEARGAVKDGWHYIERAIPGDADRDGR